MLSLLIRNKITYTILLTILMSSNTVVSQTDNNLSSSKIFQPQKNIELKRLSSINKHKNKF